MALKVEGVDYSPNGIREVRTNVAIPLRDEALKHGEFGWAVGLSRIIALLAYLAEIEEAKQWKRS